LSLLRSFLVVVCLRLTNVVLTLAGKLASEPAPVVSVRPMAQRNSILILLAIILFLPATGNAGGFQPAVPYTAGSYPGAVAVGDFNGDGIPDLAVENNGGSISIFTGSGTGTFSSATNYTTASSSGVVVADFNGDGKPDIATADYFGGKVRILINNGSGAFPTNMEFAAGSGPVFVAVGDFNGDGKPDLVVANSSTSQINVLLNTSTGGILSFGAPTPYTVGMQPFFVGVADLNGDGKLDLVTANSGSNNISVLLGAGNGTFGAANNFAAGTGPSSVVAGDFNGDGKTDLAVANYGPSSVTILLGNGSGSFQLLNSVNVGANPNSIAAVDLNGDGKLDLVTANYTDGNVSILLGHGDATFQASAQYAAGASANFVAVGDFNKDGVVDLAVADNNASGSGNTVSVLLGNGLFAPKNDFAAGTSPIAVVTGDFNKDGNQDVAVADSGTDNTVSVLFGNGMGGLTGLTPYLTGKTPFDVAAGDFNNDGNLDLFVVNNVGSFGTPLRGSSNGTFAVQSGVFDSNTFSPADAALADFNGDGILDVAMAENGSNKVSVFLGMGDIHLKFQPGVDYAVGANPISIAAGDFNGDGKPDLVVADIGGPAGANLSVLLNKGDGTGTFLPAVPYGAGTNPNEVQVGDFNGDGKLDIAVANFSSNNVSILLGNGDGTFQNAHNFPAGTNPAALTVADFNGDGKLDLAVANYGSGDVSVLLGNGDGTFNTQTRYPAGSLPNSIAAADFNNDGAPDLVVANKGGNVSILLNRAGSTLSSSSSPNPSLLTQSVTFTGVVAASISGSGIPTGTVIFKEGATVLGPPATLDGSGHATFSISSLSLGTHVVTPVYSGDLNFVSRTLPAVTQIVNVNTVTTLVSNQNPSGDGQGIILTATVTPAAGSSIPPGTVTFFQGASMISTCINVPLDNTGTAICYPSNVLTLGTYTFTAAYNGSGNHLSSTSQPLTQVVKLSSTSYAALFDPNYGCCVAISTLKFRQRIAIFASVNFESNAAVPTGTVTFYVDGKPFGSPVPLDGISHNQVLQIVSQQPNQLIVGQHTISAIYSGDANYAGFTAGPQPFTRLLRPH